MTKNLIIATVLGFSVLASGSAFAATSNAAANNGVENTQDSGAFAARNEWLQYKRMHD